MSSNKVPSCIGIALGIISQDWSRLGLGDDPAVKSPEDIDTCVERITALLLVRIVAWIQPRGTFTDLSTTTICRKVLVEDSTWPGDSLTEEFVDQLLVYVKRILTQYQDTPYHNYQHCYHVTLSINKLLEMMLLPIPDESRPTTFGLRDDPLMQLVLVWSALIHDVEHQGIPNRQLANEDDILAVQYNDTSIAEQRSLFIGFSELLKPEYELMRSKIFPESADYRRFRSAVIDLVLTTDIADPARTQIQKSKWKEAFGDTYETVERKVLRKMGTAAVSGGRNNSGSGVAAAPSKASRRMSAQSIMSELSLDSPIPNPDDAMVDDDTSISLSDADEETEETDDVDNTGRRKQQPIMLTTGDGEGPKFRPPMASSSDHSPKPPATSSSGAAAAAQQQPSTSPLRSHKNPIGRSKSDAQALYGSAKKRADDALSMEASGGSGVPGMALKFQRRLSSIGPASTSSAKRYRSTRLGLLRTVDLTGESIETYSKSAARPSATGAITSGSAGFDNLPTHPASPPEEIDALRESVVMGVLMRAADVAHNLQGWDLMAKWSNRLFLELRRAHVQGRGENPQNGWFPNQIGFLEAYLLPLARRLDDTGVFGYHAGARFAEIVEENRDRWTKEGMAVTANIIAEGERTYPSPEDESDDE